MYLSFWGTLIEWSVALEDSRAILLNSAMYDKRLHLNRTIILGGQGPVVLSIPLQGGRDQRGLLKEIQVAFTEDDWRRKHIRSIESCYRKAPYFEYYAPAIMSLYMQSFQYLWEWQVGSWETVSKLLKWPLEFGWGEELGATIELSPKLPLPTYPQLFTDRHGFQENAGILDLLFCMGPMALNYLSRLSTKKGFFKP